MEVDSGDDVIFQLLITSFSGYNEGISAGKVGLDHYMVRVGDEHLPDVWEDYYLGRMLFGHL